MSLLIIVVFLVPEKPCIGLPLHRDDIAYRLFGDEFLLELIRLGKPLLA